MRAKETIKSDQIFLTKKNPNNLAARLCQAYEAWQQMICSSQSSLAKYELMREDVT